MSPGFQMRPSLGTTQTTRQHLSLKQRQLMRQRMAQRAELFQLSHQELREYLQAEALENPFLTTDTGVSESAVFGETPGESPADSLRDPRELTERELNVGDGSARDDFERLDDMADQIPDYYEDSERPSRSAQEDADERRADFFANAPALGEDTLQNHLLAQLRDLDLTPDEFADAELVVGNLDARGVLLFSLESLFGTDPARLSEGKAALSRVQGLDPRGVGAADLCDCLLLQLDPETEDYRLARRLLREFPNDLQRNFYAKIAVGLGVSQERLHALLATLARLNPNPGSGFSQTPVERVEPDVFCTQLEDGTFYVTLNEDDLPALDIDPQNRRCLSDRVPMEDEVRQELRRKLDSAEWLIQAIATRRQNLLNIAQAIVDYQGERLRNGVDSLRPLKMEQIASATGVHAATVSRIVNGKWLQTPWGIFELRVFFTTGIQTHEETATGETVAGETATGGAPGDAEAGGAVSRNLVVAKIREIVAQEDKSAPLSDDRIMAELHKAGLPISRRTVVKYRETSGIPSSRGRKVVGG